MGPTQFRGSGVYLPHLPPVVDDDGPLGTRYSGARSEPLSVRRVSSPLLRRSTLCQSEEGGSGADTDVRGPSGVN